MIGIADLEVADLVVADLRVYAMREWIGSVTKS